MNTIASTLNDNDKSIALLSPVLLTLRVNSSMESSTNIRFGKWLKPLIESLKESQADVAKEAGITPVQLSRIVTGVSGVKRENAISIIDSINKFAGKEIANKVEGLELAGYSSDNSPKISPRVSEALGSFGDLSERNENLLLDFIESLKKNKE